MTLEDLTKTGNQIIDCFLNAMEKEGLIDNKKHCTLKGYSIVIVNKSVLGTWWDRLWRKGSNNPRIMIVKVIENIDDNDNGGGGDKTEPVKPKDFVPFSIN